MRVRFANRVKTTLSAGVAIGDATMTLSNVANLPAIGGGDYCYLTLTTPDQATIEVVKATAIAGNVVTVTRAQEGTAAVAWAMGSAVEMRLTAGGLADALALANITGLQAALDAKFDKSGGSVSGNIDAAGTIKAGSNPGAMVLNPPTATNFGFFGSDSDTGGFWFGGDPFSGGHLTIGAWGAVDGVDIYANGDTRMQIRSTGITATVPLYVGATLVSLAGHTHVIADVTGLQAALDAKLTVQQEPAWSGSGNHPYVNADSFQVGLASAGGVVTFSRALDATGNVTGSIELDTLNGAAGAGIGGALTAGSRVPIWRYGAIAAFEFDATPYVGTNAIYHAGNKPTNADVGLGNVNNTSDANKPISTATQTALDGKQAAGSYALTTGATFTGKITAKAADANGSYFNAGYGVTPTAGNQVNGDLWITSAIGGGLFYCANGTQFQVATTNSLSSYALLTGANFTGAVTVSSTVDATSPGSGTTGGIRIRAQTADDFAYFQITNHAASTEWGNFTFGSDGSANWVGTGGFKVNGVAVGGSPTPNIQNVVSAATVTPTFANDQVNITAQAVALNLANPTGTAVDGHQLIIRINDNGTGRAITYGTQYRAMGISLPTTTLATKTHYLRFVYNANATKWDGLSAQSG